MADLENATHHHCYQVLTKRGSLMRYYLHHRYGDPKATCSDREGRDLGEFLRSVSPAGAPSRQRFVLRWRRKGMKKGETFGPLSRDVVEAPSKLRYVKSSMRATR